MFPVVGSKNLFGLSLEFPAVNTSQQKRSQGLPFPIKQGDRPGGRKLPYLFLVETQNNRQRPQLSGGKPAMIKHRVIILSIHKSLKRIIGPTGQEEKVGLLVFIQ